MRRTVTWGGLYWDVKQGISRGCPLSPLLGAFFLHELDQTMKQLGLFYVRFMDDILVLSPTRWKLRRAVKTINRRLASLGLEKHPDKSFVGRVAKGFDFLGFHFDTQGVTVAPQTLGRFVERLTRLYEQEQEGSTDPSALGSYVRRWVGWIRGGMTSCGDQWPGHQVVDGFALLSRRIPTSERPSATRQSVGGTGTLPPDAR
jgi:RNA-directed DNA polymerase